MSGWSNLTMANIPGTSYLMPSGIRNLTASIPGSDFGFNNFRSLYTTPPGAGSGGGNAYHPMGGEHTDAESYVSIHVPVAPTGDDKIASYLYKEVLTFNHREPPGPDTHSEVTTLVPINWLNIWLDKMWRIGFMKYQAFARSFMTKYQSHFPNIFKHTVRSSTNRRNMGHVNTFNLSFNNVDSGDDDDDDVGGSSHSSNSDDDGTHDVMNEELIMTAFTQYLAENIPHPDLFFTSKCGDLEWLSTSFKTDSTDIKMDVWIDNFTKKLAHDRDLVSARIGNLTTYSTESDQQRSLTSDLDKDCIEDLGHRLSLKYNLLSNEIHEAQQSGSRHTASVHKHNPFNKTALEDYLKLVKDHKKARSVMKMEIMDFFRTGTTSPYHLQFKNDPDGVEYLFRGGYFRNWSWLGVINTTMDGETGKTHGYGVPFARFPVAKVNVDRETITYNIWGGDLRTGTHLYLKLERTPLIVGSKTSLKETHNSIPSTSSSSSSSSLLSFTNTNSNNGDVSGFYADLYPQSAQNIGRDEHYHKKISNVTSQYLSAWRDYGAYRLVPYHNGLEAPNMKDLEYINIFGVKERATLISVGVVKYDTVEHDFNSAAVKLALGLPNLDTRLPPTIEASKVAMIGLPKITVLLRY